MQRYIYILLNIKIGLFLDLKNDEVLIELKAPTKFYERTKKYIETNRFFIECKPKGLTPLKKEKDEEILKELDLRKSEILKKWKIEVLYKSGNLVLLLKMNKFQSGIKVEVTASQIDFRIIQPKLIWKVKETEITGWFRCRLSKEGKIREFLLNDEKLHLNKTYLDQIDKKAIKESQNFLESNILALLKDGNITNQRIRENIKEEIDDGTYNYCAKNLYLEEYIYDLMLDKYTTNKCEYNILLDLFQKSNKYKPLLKVLPKVRCG